MDVLHHQSSVGQSWLRALTQTVIPGISSGHRRPLPRLSDVHPGRPTSSRWVGLRAVPTECIHGTASAAADSRGQDFRPLVGREPADWRSRWSRLESGARNQAVLPPVQLVRAGGDYWVVDGHNRVALAMEHGQAWIDADVTELDLSSENSAAVVAKEN